jgi:hypothetical protein
VASRKPSPTNHHNMIAPPGAGNPTHSRLNTRRSRTIAGRRGLKRCELRRGASKDMTAVSFPRVCFAADMI